MTANETVIKWVAGLFGCKISYVLKTGRHKPQYFVRLSGKRVRLLCERLMPFLIVKRRQAELILEFPCDARIAPGIKIAQSEINVERERLRVAINSLNHLPRNPNTRRGVAA